MTALTFSAPGKIILFGEHAVVYARPAIAAPLMQAQARAVILPQPRSPQGEMWIEAPNIGLSARLEDLPESHPLRRAVSLVMGELGIQRIPACKLRLTSTIPVASGLGSGAAVSVALIRVLAAYLGRPLPVERVSALAYEVEKIHHGAPSGIDNTVIAYAMPVYFQRRSGIDPLVETFRPQVPFTLVIGDTGVPFPTAVAVGDLRQAWQADPAHFEPLFDAVGQIAVQARHAIEAGQPDTLGPLMDSNHGLLVEMGVSSPELDRLVDAARKAGALGAKLSGGGRGGNMIALAANDQAAAVAAALERAGAVRTIVTRIE